MSALRSTSGEAVEKPDRKQGGPLWRRARRVRLGKLTNKVGPSP